MKINFPDYYVLILMLPVFLLFSACKKQNEEPQTYLTERNQWILDSMQVYYYWNKQLPQQPQDNPVASAFFKSLLNPADRFSFMVAPDESRTEYSSFAWYGFEYELLDGFANRGVTGVIKLVVPGGPADRKGLKRGDFFTKVNGKEITALNKLEINKTLILGGGIELMLATLINGALQQGPAVSLTHTKFVEQPVYTTKILNAGGKKIGYIFYNKFNGSYDQQLLNALATLKNAAVTELVLDLRYNPGGDVSTVAKLTAALSATTENQTFVIYQANSNGGRHNSSFKQTIMENTYQPQNFNEIKNYRLGLSRVFVLTTGATASAAELLINNLKPFMSVVHVGTRTMGKDMASLEIEDYRQPKLINLTLHPLIFKLYNANGEGNYSGGLNPNHLIDEMAMLPLLPFGDPGDPMLRKVLDISGVSLTGTMQINNSISASKTNYTSTISGKYRSLPLITNKKQWVK